MKKYSALLLVVFLCVAATLTFAFTSASDTHPLPPPANAVGQFNGGNPPTIFTNDLVNTFEDGGSITTYNITELNDGWKLVRKGTLAGQKRTEIVPVALVNGYFLFQQPKWYTVCSIANCNLFCTPNAQNNACVCSGGSNCTFGNSNTQLFEVEILR